MKERCYNFSAGPAALPEPVLQQASRELENWNGYGASVMEISHRGMDFVALAEQSERDLRLLLNISDDYAVLFMQGGATAQFALLPLNLLDGPGRADYVDTGHWSQKAIEEASRYCSVEVVARRGQDTEGLFSLPPQQDWQCREDAAWLHYTPNETIDGIEFHWIPDSGAVPLVADCSSTILSRPLDVSRFGVLYAGAQKNIGPAGLTLVVIRRDLLARKAAAVPRVFNYSKVAEANSLLNTPPTFAWYLSALVFRWLLDQGGLAAIEATNRRKADKLYACIDADPLYHNPVAQSCRSRMNVPFTLSEPGLDQRFLTEAEAAGLKNLKGHRSVGGMRASLYNAVSEQAVDSLVAFMKDFSSRA